MRICRWKEKTNYQGQQRTMLRILGKTLHRSKRKGTADRAQTLRVRNLLHVIQHFNDNMFMFYCKWLIISIEYSDSDELD